MFGNIGMQELIVILVILLLLFGAKKIPELARGLGRGIHEFKRAVKEGEEAINPDESKKITPDG
ncbi:MAG: twin-arginine translocase TatA/TatE family subunit [candidate division Zixibacteria bacterium]|nr:twin-arginine translocase TatA/TatE family subunit [candidate division Zixibacteria bacterium]